MQLAQKLGHQTGTGMRDAARAFLASLSTSQREQACFAFKDNERFRWHFTPIPRHGIPFRDLLPAQQKLAYALLSTGYSARGTTKALQIMSLEQVLHEFETPRRFVRDPDLYFLTLFGDPAADAPWAWRIEGHHVSLNVTLVNGEAIATSPTFFGANPAEVRDGPRTGLRVLADEEDAARALLLSLDTGQRTRAIVDVDAPDDILSFNHHRADWLGDAGVAASSLTTHQFGQLEELVGIYASAMPNEIAAGRMAAFKSAEPNQVRFAWAGGMAPGERHYYRIQAPTFLVEYDNTQNDANHVHSVWRNFTGDWGFDLLGAHLGEAHASVANAKSTASAAKDASSAPRR